MKTSLLNVLTTCGALCLFQASACAQQVSIRDMGNGYSKVTDLNDGTVYMVKDVKTFITKKYIMAGSVDGFGKRLSEQDFRKGTPITQPVTDVVQGTQQVTAQTTRKIPVVRNLVRPFARLFGKPKHQTR